MAVKLIRKKIPRAVANIRGTSYNRLSEWNRDGLSVTLDTYTHLTEDKKKEQEAVAQTIRIS